MSTEHTSKETEARSGRNGKSDFPHELRDELLRITRAGDVMGWPGRIADVAEAADMPIEGVAWASLSASEAATRVIKHFSELGIDSLVRVRSAMIEWQKRPKAHHIEGGTQKKKPAPPPTAGAPPNEW